MKTHCVSGIAMSAILVASATSAAELPLNEKVVAYCKEHLDKPKVGNGQCAALAALALKAAGARERGGPDFPTPKDYFWGKLIYTIEGKADEPKITGDLSDVEPGDIVQYRNTKFLTAHYAHHTSIVSKVVDVEERRLKVYQQNVGGKEVVFEGVLNLGNLTEGYIRIFRPIKADK